MKYQTTVWKNFKERAALKSTVHTVLLDPIQLIENILVFISIFVLSSSINIYRDISRSSFALVYFCVV